MKESRQGNIKVKLCRDISSIKWKSEIKQAKCNNKREQNDSEVNE
jgi:hypothetical protein